MFRKIFLAGLLILAFGLPSSAENLTDWHYYSEVEVESQPWDTTQEVYADFSYLLNKAGVNKEFDENSIRVYQLDENQKVTGKPLPVGFLKDKDYEGRTNASGSIVWLVIGERDSAKSMKRYRFYFDTAENGRKELLKYDREIKEANLVPNVGFEEDKDGDGVPDRTPYFRNKPGLILDDSVRHSGKYSVRIPAGNSLILTPEAGYQEQDFSYVLRVKEGAPYVFSFYSKGEDCDETYVPHGNLYLFGNVYWYDKERNNVLPWKVAGQVLGDAPFSWDWQFTRSIVTANPGAAYGRFTTTTYCKKGTIWVDDPVITLLRPPELSECHENK